MVSAYSTETCERFYLGKNLVVENWAPAYRTWAEQEKIKKDVEAKLLIFSASMQSVNPLKHQSRYHL